MKLQQLHEAQYAIFKNPMGDWFVRSPGSVDGNIGAIRTIVLHNAKPYNDPNQKRIKHLIVGDYISGDGYEDRGLGELEPSPPATVSGTPRPIRFDPAKLNEPNAFVYADTGEEFTGSKFVVFDGKSVTAYV